MTTGRPEAEARARLAQIALGLALSTPTSTMILARGGANLDPRWIPAELRAPFAAALSQAEAAHPAPLPVDEVARILCTAWDVRAPEAELDALDPEPVAVTWGAQVHVGVLDGSRVAVKVLRPGVGAGVRRDLALLDLLSAPLGAAVPRALLAEARERMLEECDLEHEASVMRRFGRALGDTGPVVVPVPVTRLCHETVLVASWLEGEPLTGGVGLGHDSTAAALLRFVIGGIREGLMHCDLDLDDVLRLPDGRIGVVDFGATAVLSTERADGCLAALEAIDGSDPEGLDRALVQLGLSEPGHGRAALAVATAALGPLFSDVEARLDGEALAAAMGRLAAVRGDAAELLGAGRLGPGDLYPARGIAQLVSVLARIGAVGVWREQLRQALTDGWRG